MVVISMIPLLENLKAVGEIIIKMKEKDIQKLIN